MAALAHHTTQLVAAPDPSHPTLSLEEWVGVTKDVVESFKPNYSESICHVSELPSKEGYERLQDNGTHLPGVPGQQEHGPYKSSYVGA